MEIKGPFYNKKKAAEYCGYSESVFAKMIKDYDLPRLGPRGNRFSESVLDIWMVEPSSFKPQPLRRARKAQMVQV